VCIIYDCLYPHTIGGAERWYRNLALRLAKDGYGVTYMTMRQWDARTPPALPGVRVIAAAPRMQLYVEGRRRIWPPIVFGFGVLRHLAAHGSDYDLVHTASFPYFPLLAAGLLRRRCGYRLLVDWHEVWTQGYWRDYLGPVAGKLAFWIQLLCMRVRQEAFCFSGLHERRLRAGRVAGPVTVLRGQYEGELDSTGAPVVEPSEQALEQPTIVFAGRHIPEKRVTAIIPAFLHARQLVSGLRCCIYGDGPDRAKVLRQAAAAGVEDAVEAPGFVAQERINCALRSAVCLVLPSRREGYGLVVVEALARGTPVVVVNDPDNAAVEFVEEGVNGFVAASAAPDVLGEAIVRVHAAGAQLRKTTATWFAKNSKLLSIESSILVMADVYMR
jgi:glycosyltransferase involved in cell wall biosynthesis